MQGNDAASISNYQDQSSAESINAASYEYSSHSNPENNSETTNEIERYCAVTIHGAAFHAIALRQAELGRRDSENDWELAA